MSIPRLAGFTLAELLIALAILGQISVFTIPKVLNAQQGAENKSKGKEAIAMISGAYAAFTLNNAVSASTTPGALTQYMNFVSVTTDSSRQIDDSPSFGSRTCSAGNPCYQLHNGAVLSYEDGTSFGGTGPLNVLFFFFDPDGVYSGSTNGPGKALRITLHLNGRISTMGQETAGAQNSAYGLGAHPNWDPDWFSW